MSAALSEKLNTIGEEFAKLGEMFTELSAAFDAESAKSGKSGGNAAAGKVSGSGSKAAVGSKGKAAGAVDDDDLPPPTSAGKGKTAAKSAGKSGKGKAVTEDDVRAAAKKVIDLKGKEKAVEVLSEYGNGKLADVEESDYPACLAALEAALVDEEEGGADVDDI